MPRRNEADPPLLLRAALRAYPPADRRGYGDELLEAAVELSAEGSEMREAAGLVRGGTEARAARLRLGLIAVNVRRGAGVLALPLAAFVTMVWGVAAGARMAGATNPWGYHGPTAGSVVLLSLVALVVLGVARQQRGIATVAAGALALQVFASAAWQTARGGVVTAAPSLHLNVGPWWFGPNLAWSFVPLALMLVPACWCMSPAAPRVPGLPRPWSERWGVRLVVLLLPVAALAVVVRVAPQFVVEIGGGETTELPGLLFLMLIVGVLWIATSPRSRDDHAVAAALAGLAAMPSVAYGAARFLVTPLAHTLVDRDLVVGVGLALACVLVLLAAWGFVVVLAHVGLRTIDRRGGSPLAVGHAIPLGPDDPSTAG